MVSSILRDQSKENQLIVVRGGTGGGFWRTWSSIDTVVSTTYIYIYKYIYISTTKGSLEVNLRTIWRDENKRREE